MKPERKSFLILDGDRAVGRHLADFLENVFAFEVEAVTSVESAVQCLEKQPYDGLLLDRGEDDGFRVLAWLQEHNRTDPVIMMGYGADWDLLAEYVKRGAADLIGKPVQLSELERTIRWMVYERETQSRRGKRRPAVISILVPRTLTS
ncbi:response regulator [bacterium]|nr:response regulator [bacterium]